MADGAEKITPNLQREKAHLSTTTTKQHLIKVKPTSAAQPAQQAPNCSGGREGRPGACCTGQGKHTQTPQPNHGAELLDTSLTKCWGFLNAPPNWFGCCSRFSARSRFMGSPTSPTYSAISSGPSEKVLVRLMSSSGYLSRNSSFVSWSFFRSRFSTISASLSHLSAASGGAPAVPGPHAGPHPAGGFLSCSRGRGVGAGVAATAAAAAGAEAVPALSGPPFLPLPPAAREATVERAAAGPVPAAADLEAVFGRGVAAALGFGVAGGALVFGPEGAFGLGAGGSLAVAFAGVGALGAAAAAAAGFAGVGAEVDSAFGC